MRRGDANVAVLLTWFLPGAGHLYLGRFRTGLVAFLLIEGLYALGWFLCDGRTFEYLDAELRSPLATLLTPEAGNLGAMLLHLKVSSFGEVDPVPFPATMVAGTFMSALSGVLNLFAATLAHLDARSGDARAGDARAGDARAGDARAGRTPARSGLHPVLVLGCAWLVPGLGHWLQGRRLRALLVFGLLLGLFVAGTWLAAGTNLSRERHFYYWSGQYLLGGPALLLEGLAGHPRVTGELPLADVGLLYACMAGLLNVLALLDVYGVAERRWLAPETVANAPGPAGEVPA